MVLFLNIGFWSLHNVFVVEQLKYFYVLLDIKPFGDKAIFGTLSSQSLKLQVWLHRMAEMLQWVGAIDMKTAVPPFLPLFHP